MSELETKDKIMQAARALFSVKGYEGASVREIAAEAGVNIAAVNYHFTSKEKLFFLVIDSIFAETSNHIRARRATHPNEKAEDAAVWIFGHFLENSDILRSVFKMMLSEKGWGEDQDCNDEDEKFGPPGGMALAEAITHELKHEVSEADMFWAVKTIFAYLVHMALMYSNHLCHMKAEDAPYHTREVLEADLRRLVRVVLKEL
jgi:AcrR family transcriptional regulator